MSSSKKETKNIYFINKLFASLKPHKKRRAVFFGLGVVLILGFFLALLNTSHAAFTMTPAQKNSFIDALYKDPTVSTLYSTNAAGRAQVESKVLPDYLAKYNSYNEALTALQSVPGYGQGTANSGDALADSLNNFQPAGVGKAIADWIGEKILQVVIGVLYIIASFLKLLVEYAAKALDLTLNPALYSFTSNDMIVQGWTMVRDVCNLFFLLVLLFIAICTILKIEKYHAKKTLLMLIIMALLINFSKPIAIFIFDGSQLLMNFFLRQMGQTGTGTSSVVAQASYIANLVYDTLPQNQGTVQIAIQYLFGVVFLFMLGVAFLVTALMLLIRIVAIMMLIIVSPFAFFAAIIPDFSKMSSQWWSALFEYSYYGPAAAFFLLLATKLQGALPNVASLGKGQTLDTTVFNIIHYLVVLIFLYASIIMAKKFGGGAGAAIVGNANRFMKWGGGMTKGGGFWGGAARVTGAASVYQGVKGGISKRPVLGYFTKEGREAKRKGTQEKWERKFAPFNIATVKEQAKKRENDSKENIIRDALKGLPEAIVVAAQKGYDKDNESREIWTNPTVSQALQNDDLRKATYDNLKDKGKTHLVIDSEIQRRNLTGNDTEITKLYQDELGGLTPNNLGKQDLGELSKSRAGEEWVAGRLKQFDEIDSRMISNMLSGGNANNPEFIRNFKSTGALPNYSSQSSRQSGGGTQSTNAPQQPLITVVNERPPISRTKYDEQGRVVDENGVPIT